MNKNAPANQDKPDTYQQVIDVIHRKAPKRISDIEAKEAANNLMAFCQLALEIRRERLQNTPHVISN